MSAGELVATVLGCGSSGGVPRIGLEGPDWGACDPADPRNRRTRCSLLVQRAGTNLLIDTSPDLREQLITARCGRLDAVLITHEHADQLHGLDDLRMVAQNMRRRVDVYADAPTAAAMLRKFGYCFETPPGSDYPPILTLHRIEVFRPFTVTGAGGPLTIEPFDQDHGAIRSLGFRIGPLAYTSDAVGLPEQSFALIDRVPCWILDALRYRPHPTHAHVDLALDWIGRVRPGQAYLTNLHIDLDYATLAARLPNNVSPAYDGLKLRFAL